MDDAPYDPYRSAYAEAIQAYLLGEALTLDIPLDFLADPDPARQN